MIRIRRALLSAYHKEGLDELAAALRDTGAEILSTGGTYRWLLDRGFAAVSLEERYGLPSRFGGRVKTLHPSIHGGILYRRGDPQDEADREALRIDPIDLVAIDLYPFEETARRDPSARAAAIEMIDIGGPTMLRAAAKNHASVAVVCDPADYGAVANALREGRGSLAEPLLEALAVKVFETTAAYDARVASYLQPKESLPDAFARGERRLWALRYGENPSQRGAFYGPPAGYPGGMRKLQGKEISFNNLQDMEAAATLARDLMPEPCLLYTSP
ncbi:MAG: bifunctional phosphoribosylaminoimidazolecarboxamide formyltransferase/IMP cyclohydrolase, partial [Candidatus Eisenbacteria bacterium]|nr:bifunctional phosphoribosylaminoimidazolecarboxamide formyltransferase/IMP cyclohydrolase [Candidatus Eisenbacteria bacterium]